MPTARGEFSWIFFIPTVILLGLSLFFLVKNLRVMFQFQRTTGEVIRFEDSRVPNGGQTVYQTIVRYETPDGLSQEAGSLTRSSSVSHKIGDKITVYFDPAHPEQAQLYTFRDSWLHILILGGIGFILFVIWNGIRVGTPVN